MIAHVSIVILAPLLAIAIYSLIDWNNNSEVPLEHDEVMLIYLRNNPDHVVSTADTQYLEHRTY